MNAKQTDNHITIAMAKEIQFLTSLITKVSHQAMHQYLAEHGDGISVLQFGILRMLHDQPLTISELSRKFVLDPSTLVSTVDTLERKGLLARGQDPNDRRRIPLSLTATGKDLLACIPHMQANDPLLDSLQQLGDQRATQLLHLLREVMRNLPDGETTLQEIQSRVALIAQDNATPPDNSA